MKKSWKVMRLTEDGVTFKLNQIMNKYFVSQNEAEIARSVIYLKKPRKLITGNY